MQGSQLEEEEIFQFTMVQVCFLLLLPWSSKFIMECLIKCVH